MKINSLVKTFLIYGLTSGISRFISLLLIPLYVRIFSTSENGVIDMIQTIVQVSMIFGVLQLESSIQRFYYDLKEDDRKVMISTIIAFVFVLSLLISISIYLTSSLISNYFFKTNFYTTEISIAGFIIPLINISILNFIVLRYDKKAFAFSSITFMQVIITTSFIILFSMFLKWGIKSVFLGQLLGYIFVIIAQFIYIRKQLTLIFSWKILKKSLQFCIPEFPARIGSESVSRMNRFILLYYLSTSALGVYAVAIKFASSMELITNAFIMSWRPYMYESLKISNYKTKFLLIYEITLYLSSFFILSMSLYSNEIINLFTTEEYYMAKYLLPGLFLFYGLYLIKTVVDIGPAISKKMIYVPYIYFTVSIFNVIFLLLGVSFFSLKGIVYAQIFTNFFLIIFSWFITEKLHPIGYNIKNFIFTFFCLFLLIILLMNIELGLPTRLAINIFIAILFLLHINKNKTKWKEMLF